ncbi:MAG: ribosomal protein S18-alanine N-acetyltransferase [Sodalis sp. (in: enterobacteria)]
MNTILPLLLPADLTEAWNIEQASHTFPWSAKTLAENQGKRYLNFKLCIDDYIAAFAITQTVLDQASLFNITVHPAFQKKGHGRALLLHLIAQLKQRKLLMLWLEVRQSNAQAIGLYRALGFNEVFIRRHYYRSRNGREDAVIMALPLG